MMWNALLAALLLALAGWLFGGAVTLPALPLLDLILLVLSFGWLLLIVTVPWNLHFTADAALREAKHAEAAGRAVDASELAYAERLRQRSLQVAIGLHLLTAAVLLGLALAGVSPLGYAGAGAALALTLMRPGLKAYQHMRERLSTLRRELVLPREDGVELGRQLRELRSTVEQLSHRLEPDARDSLPAQIRELEQRVDALATHGRDRDQALQLSIEQVRRDADSSIARVLGDAAIVGHVRELVRFFKQA
ncbi:MAG: hypothetical protein MUE46_00530 [Xanthomonadales bacterium]|nr:hypothetical protein [Xanthomonadales bacterium]